MSVQEALKHGYRIALKEGGPEKLGAFLSRAVREQIPIYSFSEQKRRLEDAFVEMVTKKDIKETDV